MSSATSSTIGRTRTPSPSSPSVFLADLEMLVIVGGRERTTEAYAGLFERSGLRLARTISLGSSKDAMGLYFLEPEPV